MCGMTQAAQSARQPERRGSNCSRDKYAWSTPAKSFLAGLTVSLLLGNGVSDMDGRHSGKPRGLTLAGC